MTNYSIELHELISHKIYIAGNFSNFHTVQNVWRRKCQMHFFNFVYTSCQYFFLLCKIARNSKTLSHVWKRILCNFMATWNGIIGKFIQNLFQISVSNFLYIHWQNSVKSTFSVISFSLNWFHVIFHIFPHLVKLLTLAKMHEWKIS